MITNPSEKKGVTLHHFEHRMRKRPVMNEVEEIVELNNELFKVRLKEAESKKSPSFSLKELNIVLKCLKSGKSKDPNGYICELFGAGVIGTDPKNSLLLMMNRMKNLISIPHCLKSANITVLHKKKSKLDLNNY